MLGFFTMTFLLIFYQVNSVGKRQVTPEVTGSSWGEVRHEEAHRTSLLLQTDCRWKVGVRMKGHKKETNSLNAITSAEQRENEKKGNNKKGIHN